MPIQWSGPVNSPYKLAQVITGEAGSARGQFAVASVMYNRLQSPGFGNTLSEVVTPTQFNGFKGQPSPAALAFANDLWSGGDLSRFGSTGNALYFAANSADARSAATRSFVSGAVSGGENIGGNYFTDRFGAPSSRFEAPSYGGLAKTGDHGLGSIPANDQNFAGEVSYFEEGNGLGAYDFGAGTNTSKGAEAAGIPQKPAAGSADDFMYQDFNTNGQSFDQMQIAGSMTVPQAIDKQSEVIQKASETEAKAEEKAAETLAQTSKANTASWQEQVATWYDEAVASSKNIFVRAAIIIFAVIVIAIALYSIVKKGELEIPSFGE